MEKDLIKFYNNISFINKEIAKYVDEKGNAQLIAIGQLLCNCTYNELDKEQMKQAKFSGLVEDGEYNIIDVKRPVSKYEITKDKKDMYTLTDKQIKASQVWVVQNSLKVSKSFNNKEEALKVMDEINNKVLKQAEIK